MSVDSIIAARVAEWKKTQLKTWEESIPQALRGYDLDALLKTRWSGKLTVVQTKNFKKYLDRPTKFLVLCGPSGMGKTVMGVEVCQRLLEEGICSTALYVGAPTMMSDLSFGFHDGVDVIAKYSSPDVLLLDDVGAGTIAMSDTRKNGLWAIIDRRWSQGKYTIISTNLPPVPNEGKEDDGFSLKEYMGESSWDRVMSSYTLITFSGTSLRKQAKRRTTTTTRRRSRQKSEQQEDE